MFYFNTGLFSKPINFKFNLTYSFNVELGISTFKLLTQTYQFALLYLPEYNLLMNLTGKEFQPITTAVVPESLDYNYFAAKYLGDIDPDFHGEIAYAFTFAQNAHAGKKRESGEDYMSHPIMCAIYAVELGFTQPFLIEATLLHDTEEDGTRFLMRAQRRIYEARRRSLNFRGDTPAFSKYDLMRTQFSVETADLVHVLTLGRGMKLTTYVQRLLRGPMLARPIKGFDRFHNLRTLPTTNPDRVRKKIDETREVYMPVFEMAAN